MNPCEIKMKNGAEGVIWTHDNTVFSRAISQADLPRHVFVYQFSRDIKITPSILADLVVHVTCNHCCENCGNVNRQWVYKQCVKEGENCKPWGYIEWIWDSKWYKVKHQKDAGSKGYSSKSRHITLGPCKLWDSCNPIRLCPLSSPDLSLGHDMSPSIHRLGHEYVSTTKYYHCS